MSPKDAVASLIAAGWTEARIADEVQTSQPTINRIKNGSSPRFELGTVLMALAKKHGKRPDVFGPPPSKRKAAA